MRFHTHTLVHVYLWLKCVGVYSCVLLMILHPFFFHFTPKKMKKKSYSETMFMRIQPLNQFPLLSIYILNISSCVYLYVRIYIYIFAHTFIYEYTCEIYKWVLGCVHTCVRGSYNITHGHFTTASLTRCQ